MASFRIDSILLTEGSILRDLGLTLLVSIGRHLTDQASFKMGTGSFLGVKCGRGVLLTIHPFYCRGHGRVEQYLYPPSGPHRACKRVTLPLPF